MNAFDATLPALYATIAPIFLVVASGFLSVKLRWLSPDVIRALATYVATIAAPAMVFHAIATSEPGALTQPAYLAGYAVGSGVAFAISFVLLRTWTDQSAPGIAFGALGGSFGNSLMVGFPLAVLLFGETAAVALSLTLLVEVAIMLPLALTLADISRDSPDRAQHPLLRNLLTAARNPLFIAMVCGAATAWSGVSLPDALDSGLGMLARTVAPVGLFVIGGLIVGYSPVGDWTRQGVVVASKLTLHPIAVFCAMLAFGVADPLLIGPALCFAASPIFGAYAALSQRYNLGRESAAVMITTTVGAAFTLPLMLWLLAQALRT